MINDQEPHSNSQQTEAGIQALLALTKNVGRIATNAVQGPTGPPGSPQTPRVTDIVSSATPGPSAATTDQFDVTALAVGATFASPGAGSPGQKLIIRIKDNGVSQALAWNAIYRAGTDVALPAATTINKTLYLGFIFNAADTKWDLMAVVNNI